MRALRSGIRPTVCLCGEKKHPVELLKTDATSFYTQVAVADAAASVCRMLGICSEKGFDRVFVPHEKTFLHGWLGTPASRAPQRCFQILFSEIEATLRCIMQDTLFCVGSEVWEQLLGLAMGHACSPVLCQCFLEEKWFSTLAAKKQGEICKGRHLSIEQLMQPCLHVDDCLWISKALCGKCMFAKVQRIWEGVQVSAEEEGQHVTFLHCRVTVGNDPLGPSLHVFPEPVNIAFALGRSSLPEVSRLGLFVNRTVQSRFDLRSFLWAHLYSSHFCGNVSFALLCGGLGVLLAEPLLLLWPCKWVAWACRSFPRRNRSMVADTIRLWGKRLAHDEPFFTALQLEYMHGGFSGVPMGRAVLDRLDLESSADLPALLSATLLSSTRVPF